MLKRVLYSAFTVVFVLSLVACGNNEQPNKNMLSGVDTSQASTDSANESVIHEIKADEEVKNAPYDLTVYRVADNKVKLMIDTSEIISQAREGNQLFLTFYEDGQKSFNKEGAIAFQFDFYENEKGLIANVFPKKCMVEHSGQNQTSTWYEDMFDEEGYPIHYLALVENDTIVLKVEYDGISDLLTDCSIYEATLDYNTLCKNACRNFMDMPYTIPDLSEFVDANKIDISFFDEIQNDYVMICMEYEPYKEMTLGWYNMFNAYVQQEYVVYGWVDNCEAKATSVLVGAFDEYGLTTYYRVTIFDTKENLFARFSDNIIIEEVTGENKKNEGLITDDFLVEQFIPKGDKDVHREYSCKVVDNVLYEKVSISLYDQLSQYFDENIPMDATSGLMFDSYADINTLFDVRNGLSVDDILTFTYSQYIIDGDYRGDFEGTVKRSGLYKTR